MTIAGLHVAAGTVYLAICDQDDSTASGVRPRTSVPSRVSPAVGLSDAAQLQDVMSRLSQDFRTYGVQMVSVLHTRLHVNWKYAAAFTRSSLITCALLAAQANGLTSRVVKVEAAARAVGLPVRELSQLPLELFGLQERPPHWRAGLSEASSAAAAILKQDRA